MNDILFIPPIKLNEFETFFETLIQNSVRKVLSENSLQNENQPEPDKWFDLNEVCNYLPDKQAKATVYDWVHKSLIPCHKGNKKLRFLKSEIDVWLKTGKKLSLAESSKIADEYLKNKRA